MHHEWTRWWRLQLILMGSGTVMIGLERLERFAVYPYLNLQLFF